jgi:hypothetical protein
VTSNGRWQSAVHDSSQVQTNFLLRSLDRVYLFLLSTVALFLTVMWFMCMDPARFIELMTKNPAMFIDFCKVYGLSKMVYAGSGNFVYMPAAQHAYLKAFIPAACFEAFVFLPYPPFIYALFLPFAVLPMVPSYALWTISTAVLGIGSVLYLRTYESKSDTGMERLFLVMLLCSSVFFFNNFILGQTAWLMIALLSIFFVSLVRNDDTICGVILGLCTIKFQFLLLLGTPLLVLRKWRAIFIGAIIFIGFVFIALFSIGVKNVLDYPAVLSVQEVLHPNIPLMINLRGLLFVISPRTDHFNAACCGITGALCIFFLWMKARTRQQKWNAISLSTLAYLVFSPHVFVYDGMALAIPVTLTLQRLSLFEFMKVQDVGLKIRLLLLATFPLAGWAAYFCGNQPLGRTLLCVNLALLALGLKAYVGTFPKRNPSSLDR